jgi:hypothetical protein
MEEFRLLSFAPPLTSSDRTKGQTSDRYGYLYAPHPNGYIHSFSHVLRPLSFTTVSRYRITDC